MHRNLVKILVFTAYLFSNTLTLDFTTQDLRHDIQQTSLKKRSISDTEEKVKPINEITNENSIDDITLDFFDQDLKQTIAQRSNTEVKVKPINQSNNENPPDTLTLDLKHQDLRFNIPQRSLKNKSISKTEDKDRRINENHTDTLNVGFNYKDLRPNIPQRTLRKRSISDSEDNDRSINENPTDTLNVDFNDKDLRFNIPQRTLRKRSISDLEDKYRSINENPTDTLNVDFNDKDLRFNIPQRTLRKRSIPDSEDNDRSINENPTDILNVDFNYKDLRFNIPQRTLRKRSIPDSENKDGTVNGSSSNNDTCIGEAQYCNLSREEYVEMLTNYVYPQMYEWVLIVTHTVVFVVGLVGNALVCVAVYRNHTMRTVTNYFIVNLAIADFMVILICLPPTVLWDVTETWFFGSAMCKIILYFQSVSVTVSVLTLTFISVDRWFAICLPFKFKKFKSTPGRANIAIIIIWLVSLTFNAPELVVLTTEKSVPLRFELEFLVQCIATWSPQSDLVWHILKLLFIYTIPLLLMTVAYYQIVKVLWRSHKIPGQAETDKLAPAEKIQLRSRRKAAKMLAAVVIMFAVCYFPVHLLSMLRYSVDMEQNDAVTCLALVSHVLCYANSAINPLIYNFMNGKFRREFRRAFCCSNPVQENFTTLTRLTFSSKKKHDLSIKTRRPTQSYNNNCNTAFF